jgi:hypothetical protein
MFIIPFQVSQTEYTLFIALDQENIDRIKNYDPAEVVKTNLGQPWSGLALKDVIIGFATEEEKNKVMELWKAGQPQKALRLLSRGFKFRPDRGDSDDQYQRM